MALNWLNSVGHMVTGIIMQQDDDVGEFTAMLVPASC
jgi:hypothetical protein